MEVEYFRYVIKFFLKDKEKENKKVHYIRFGFHKPLLETTDHIIVHELDPTIGFEKFTVNIYKIIMEAGKESYFIFDNISILGEYWNTDLMLGNFFQATCPVLTYMEDVTIFPLRRGEHSFDCIEKIRENTQIFLDVFHKEPYYYVTPLKVQDRYNGQMFLTHRLDRENNFLPLTYSTSLARYYSAVDDAGPGEQLQDSWDRYFIAMQLNYANREISEEDRVRMCDMLMTSDERMASLIKKHFKTRDFLRVHSRMVGTGKIGGKACGMLLARQIIQNQKPEVAEHFEPHDSYFVGSDIYYTYIIHNKFWDLWLKHKSQPENLEIASRISEKMMKGKFPASIRAQFKRLLDYYGTSPVIVRSSSFLEDGFGNAFAGKYESVFVLNKGSLNERLHEFEEAIRVVYASTMSPSALEYRRRRNLLEVDEQMALLVQRVSGSRLGSYYIPMAAGVGYSYNSYPWSDELDPNAGMLRLVAGLGTRAVDRTPGDYPRLVSLDKPSFRTHNNAGARQKYSQHKMDVLDFDENRLTSKYADKLYESILPWQRKLIYSHNMEAEWMFRERGIKRQVFYVDCENLVKDETFTSSMQKILLTLQKEYESPVDIEYTINTSEEGDTMINLLQCRPLMAMQQGKIQLPDVKEKNMFLHIKENAIGSSRKGNVDVIVHVDPYAYYTLNYNSKPNVARAIGKINQYFTDKGLNMFLITPGRIGTSSPELGVPVSFAEISEFNAIMEVAYSKVGYMPELSFGSHMFQDLVEAEILYIACMESSQTKTYQPDFLNRYERICTELFDEEMNGIISVYRCDNLVLGYDNQSREVICGME
ncbi:MAG: phosphoenolpyruvate synthase, partial [Holdemanella sp.]|nr:phosphoenolpyruvate synthase [Holdemanella sp.]